MKYSFLVRVLSTVAVILGCLVPSVRALPVVFEVMAKGSGNLTIAVNGSSVTGRWYGDANTWGPMTGYMEVALTDEQSYNVTVSADSTIIDYVIKVHPPKTYVGVYSDRTSYQGTYVGGRDIAINDKQVDTISLADVAAAGGVFSVRPKLHERIDLGDLDMSDFANHKNLRFGMGVDRSGHSGGLLVVPAGGYFGPAMNLQFINGVGTLDVPTPTTTHVQGRSPEGYVDAVFSTDYKNITINFYRQGTSNIPKGTDGFYQFTSANLASTGTVLSATYSLVQTSTYPNTYPSSNPTVFNGPVSGTDTTITRTIAGETRVYEYQDYDYTMQTVVHSQNPYAVFINHEHCTRIWAWRQLGAPLPPVVELLYHSSMYQSDGQGTWQGIGLVRNVYAGADRSSAIVYTESSNYPNGDTYMDQNPTQSQKGGIQTVVDGTYTPSWDTSGLGLPGYHYTSTFQTENFTETYGPYKYSPGNNLGSESMLSSGQIRQVRKVFLSNSLGSSQDLVTNFSYVATLGNAKILPASIVTTQGGVETARQTLSYAAGAFNGLETLQTVQDDFTNSTSYLVTTKVQYSPRALDSDFRGRPLYIAKPDGSATAYAYQRGTLASDGSWSTDTSSGVLGSGPNVRVIELHGKVGSTVNLIFGIPIPAIDLDNGNTLAKESIVDAFGHLVKEGYYLYNNGSFVPVSAIYYGYDVWGNLCIKADQPIVTGGAQGGRVLYSATYVGHRKTQETDENGVTYVYNYNAYDQVASRVRQAASGGFFTAPAQTVTYTYDNADHVLTEVTSASGTPDSLTHSITYDTYGRAISDTLPGSLTTGYSYNWSSYQTIQTNPDSGTRISTVFADGRPMSITGTGVSAISYAYSYDSAGNLVETKTAASGQWQRTTLDHLARTIKVETPAQGGGTLVISNSYNSAGLLASVDTLNGLSTKLLPTHLYQYDAYGRLYREALDSNNDGTITIGVDKDIKEYRTAYKQLTMSSSTTGTPVSNPTQWYYYEAQLVWPYGPGDGSGLDRSSESRFLFEKYVQLSGLSYSTYGHTLVADFDRNWQEKVVSLDYANANRTESTYATGSSQVASDGYVVGLHAANTNWQGQTFDYIYDGLDRLGAAADPRIGSTTYSYVPNSTLVSSTVAPDGKETRFQYTYGRVSAIFDPLNKASYLQYDLMGNKIYVWGDVPNPVWYEYDSSGRKVRMHTYRSGAFTGVTLPTAFGNGDVTTWAYDANSGVLNSKADAAGQVVSFNYDELGRITQRTDARGWHTYYTYFGLANSSPSTGGFNGLLSGVSYSDGITPSVGYTYDRAGKVKTVTDVSGTRTLNYYESWTDATYDNELRNKSGRLKSETLPSFFGSHVLLYDYQYQVSGRANGPRSSLQIDNSGVYSVAYAYDDRLRFASIAANGGTAFYYNYLAGSNLISSVTRGFSSYDYSRTSIYEPNSNRLTNLKQSWGGGAVNPLETRLFYDGRGLRTAEKTVGPAYLGVLGRSDAGVEIDSGFDDRREVTSASKSALSSSWVSGGSVGSTGRNYGYDPIGNRTLDQGGSYVANGLNQYTAVAGNSLSYDPNGNLLSDGTYTYTYDGENRLVSAASSSVKSNFRYDYLGRRISKVVSTYIGGSWMPQSEVRYIFDGWNVVAEVNTNGILGRRYLWSIDASETLDGAGGVGGLLSIMDGASSFFPIYDASYDVIGLYDQNGTIAAAYEYDPFGGIQNAQGYYAASNTIRQATRFYDAEVGLVYYGKRYYSPQLGRFVNRDPIEEAGGINLYEICGNDLLDDFDVLGNANYTGTGTDNSTANDATDNSRSPTKQNEDSARVKRQKSSAERKRDDKGETKEVKIDPEMVKDAWENAFRQAAIEKYGIEGWLFHGGAGDPDVATSAAGYFLDDLLKEQLRQQAGDGAVNSPNTLKVDATLPGGGMPEGHDPSWRSGTDNRGPYVQDPKTGTKWYPHPEDKGHWPHWDDEDNKTRYPEKSLKPRPGQKRPPYGDQSATNPWLQPPPTSQTAPLVTGREVAGGVAAVGAGYLIYRGVRMLPSLFPPLWWTIPENVVVP